MRFFNRTIFVIVNSNIVIEMMLVVLNLILVCLVCGLTFQSTAMVMSRRSVDLRTNK